MAFAMLARPLLHGHSDPGHRRKSGAQERLTRESLGTFPVTGPLFTVLLVSTIIIVGALTFFPALSLGPILEHLQMLAGKVY